MALHAMWFRSREIVQSLCAALALMLFNGCYGLPGPAGEVVVLAAEAVLPIECEIMVEPSGLCLRDGQLFSVSDDTDDTIFRVERERAVARFVPALKFTKPEGADGRLDLEGIVVGPSGSFFLLSEGYARVLQVYPDGQSVWVTASVQEEGAAKGFFRARGGGLEGLASLGDGQFLLLAERQPRGWFEVNAQGTVASAIMSGTRFSRDLALTRIPDFAGADRFGRDLFALFRNGEMITTLHRKGREWEEGPVAWSFASFMRDPRWSYRDNRFGMAEGVAVDTKYFYVVIDNNGTAHTADARDRRPLLLILKRP